jgi:hypothetical protein
VLFRSISRYEPDRVVRLAALKSGDDQTARNNLSWSDRREIAAASRTLGDLSISGLARSG